MTVGPHWRAKEISVYWVEKKKKKKLGDMKAVEQICVVYLGMEHVKECAVL